MLALVHGETSFAGFHQIAPQALLSVRKPFKQLIKRRCVFDLARAQKAFHLDRSVGEEFNLPALAWDAETWSITAFSRTLAMVKWILAALSLSIQSKRGEVIDVMSPTMLRLFSPTCSD
jgi:hypothetical protein